MKETTKKILWALAGADDGKITGLKLWHDLYPRVSVEATIEAYKDFCIVKTVHRDDEFTVVDIETRQSKQADTCVIEEFLNHLTHLSARAILTREH